VKGEEGREKGRGGEGGGRGKGRRRGTHLRLVPPHFLRRVAAPESISLFGKTGYHHCPPQLFAVNVSRSGTFLRKD